jgi:ClpP class serine protease
MVETSQRKQERRKIIESVIAEEKRKVKERETALGGLVDASMDFHDAISRLQKSAADYQSAYRVTQKEISDLLELSGSETRLVFEKRATPAASSVAEESDSSDSPLPYSD